LPTVSVVIPALNASRDLPHALESIRAQDYPAIIETIVAAGDDATASVAVDAGARVVNNEVGTTPVGLNRAIAESRGDVIVRCDAQSTLPPEYVTRAVETLGRTGADNVGGMQVPVGVTPRERAIAGAMASPLGAGDARYRIGGAPGPAETVYLGVYRRATLETLGGFDETFERSQDYELNHRINESGGTVWFDPELKVGYRPRDSFSALSRQYFAYGSWKRRMASIHRGSLRWRQLAPPIAVGVLVASLVTSVFVPVALVVPLVYLVAVTMASLTIPAKGLSTRLLIPIALVTMHLSWGSGFLVGSTRRTR
jgi:glycosyltransferase involved in cell wall biosynthesis